MRQAGKDVRFFCFSCGRGKAFDLLSVTGDRLLFHRDTVEQMQRLIGTVGRQHFLEDVQIFLM